MEIAHSPPPLPGRPKGNIVAKIAVPVLLFAVATEVVFLAKLQSTNTIKEMEARYADLKQQGEATEIKYKADMAKAEADNAELKQRADAQLTTAKATIEQAKANVQGRTAKAQAELTQLQAESAALDAEIKAYGNEAFYGKAVR